MAEKGCSLDEEADLKLLLALDKDSLSAKETLQKFILLRKISEQFYLIGIKEIYDTLPEGIVIKPVKDALSILAELSKEAKLVLVSRGKPDHQLFKMEKAGIDSSIFYKIFISEKQDKKKYYEQVIEELSLLPSEVIVCGDRVGLDLAPAKDLGCITVHMKWGRGTCEQELKDKVDFTIASLREILDVIKQIRIR